jgi:hypothetical protein
MRWKGTQIHHGQESTSDGLPLISRSVIDLPGSDILTTCKSSPGSSFSLHFRFETGIHYVISAIDVQRQRGVRKQNLGRLVRGLRECVSSPTSQSILDDRQVIDAANRYHSAQNKEPVVEMETDSTSGYLG